MKLLPSTDSSTVTLWINTRLAPRQVKPAKPRVNRIVEAAQFGGAPFSGALAFAVLAVFGIGIAADRLCADRHGPARTRRPATPRQLVPVSTRSSTGRATCSPRPSIPNSGRRTVMPLERISPYLQQATIAIEDANFYRHGGVDPVALVRALYYAVQEGDIVSGGSTIPQQLVKMVLLSPERTIRRKVNEAILSTEVSRRYSKDQMLGDLSQRAVLRKSCLRHRRCRRDLFYQGR